MGIDKHDYNKYDLNMISGQLLVSVNDLLVDEDKQNAC